MVQNFCTLGLFQTICDSSLRLSDLRLAKTQTSLQSAGSIGSSLFAYISGMKEDGVVKQTIRHLTPLSILFVHVCIPE